MTEGKVVDLSRRKFLRNAGLTVAGIAVASSGLGMLVSGCAKETDTANGNGNGSLVVPEWPYQYKKLNPDLAAERAYAAYKVDG
jgi:hypothetical protein